MGNTIQKPNQTSEDLKEEQQPQVAGEDVSSFTCEICVEPVSSNMLFGFNNTNSKCSHHSYCHECVQNYIQAKVEEYNLYEIKCPGLECDEFLDPLMCRTFLSEKVFVKWCDALCESTLSGYQKAYCPFQNCSTLIVNECGGNIGNTKASSCLPLLFLFFFLSTSSAALGGRRLGLAGGWTPIKDVKDPHVQELGKYAVSEYNQEEKANLQFVEVVRGETQVVSGENYRLVVAAEDGGATNNYEAVVWEKPWAGFKNLTSFKQV